ncbi:MAG: hypothetical protein Q7O66_14745, partial [Dehalococcoidia bacterium]|nr:hypothetical protein [Dehalococcoidia bacterium]
LFVSELYSLLQGIPGVQYVQDLSIYPIDPTTRARGVAITQVTPQPDGLLGSHLHNVVVTG